MRAKELGVASVVVTFDVDPDEVLKSHPVPKKLLSNDDRIKLLSRSPADYVLVVPFTLELAALPYDEFVEKVLGSFAELVGIHVGFDFRLGRGAKGTVATLTEWGEPRGCEIKGYDLLEMEGHPVTATRIRELVAAGDVRTASALLGRPFYVRGTVIEGRHEGAKFGWPTANVELTVPYAPIADGVYAGWCEVEGTCLPAAINAGYPPTFEGDRNLCKLEPHIIGFSGDLYGKELTVSFAEHIRGPKKFESIEALKQTVRNNIEWTRATLEPKPADELGYPR